MTAIRTSTMELTGLKARYTLRTGFAVIVAVPMEQHPL